MAKQYFVTILVILAISLLEVSSRPNNESPELIDNLNKNATKPINIDKIEEARSAPPVEYSKEQEENRRNILNRIQSLNDQFEKPYREQMNLNKPINQRDNHLEIDEELLAKIQHLVASGKLNAFSDVHKPAISNYLNEERFENGRSLAYGNLQPVHSAKRNNILAIIPTPYMIAAVPYPSLSNMNGVNDIDSNSIEPINTYQTKQSFLPSFLPSFNLQWPLAPYFPIHLKDPVLGILHGGGWENFIEYGQAADVCNRKQKSNSVNEKSIDLEDSLKFQNIPKSRQARAIKKRTVSTKPPSVQKVEEKPKATDSKPKKFFSKPLIPVKKPTFEHQTERTKYPYESEPDQDLRFPFGGDIGGWFFHKKPQVPSPGFFINRLKVKKGGVAIAGPGGVATAGKGGTAIVGPGGLAYTQPGGVAVAGPSARVIALASGVDLNTVVTRLREQAAEDGSIPRLIESIPEGKLVATGPVIYYHPAKE